MKNTLFILLLLLSSTVYANGCDDCDNDCDEDDCRQYFNIHSDEPYYMHNSIGTRFLIEPRYLCP